MTMTDDRSRWHRMADAVLGTLEDLRPITQRSARKRGNRAFRMGVQVGMENPAGMIQEQAKRGLR